MFDRTLNSSWDERSRRGVTTLTSFGLQALAVGVLLALPLEPTKRTVMPPLLPSDVSALMVPLLVRTTPAESGLMLPCWPRMVMLVSMMPL